MARTLLIFFERLLIAAVSVVLAAIVVSLFLRALRGPDIVITTVASDDPIETDTGPVTTELVPITFPSGPCVETSPDPVEGLRVVTVYFTCGNSVLPTADNFVYRRVAESERLLAATINELLQGPSAQETDLGFRSVFSVSSAGGLESAKVTNGEAVVDFTDLPQVVGIAALNDIDFFVANLNANVFQFDAVQSVEYRLEGSCVAFWDFLGDGSGCRIIARENFEAAMAKNRAE